VLKHFPAVADAYAMISLTFAALGLVALFIAWRCSKRLWESVDTPNSDAAHVFVGTNEISGTVRALPATMVSPISGRICVYRHIVVTRKTSTDSEATVIRRDTWSTPFEVVDATGAVLVQPNGVIVGTDRSYDRSLVEPLHGRSALSGALGLNLVGGTSWSEEVETEHALCDGDPVHIYGHARLRCDGVVGVEFANRDSTGASQTLRINAGTEARDQSTMAWWRGVGLGVGIVALVGALPLSLPVEQQRPAMVVSASVVTMALIVAWCIRTYNRVVSLRQRRRQAESLVDVALVKRDALVEPLVLLAGAAFSHERRVLETVSLLRTVAQRGDPGALAEIEAHAHQIRALIETIPSLQAHHSAQMLQRSLVELEDLIAFSRRFLIDTDTALNDRLGVFPDRFIASLVPA
jgi:LemA protein